MKIKFTIKARALKALAMFVGSDTSRYVLCNARLDGDALVAIEGRCLLVFRATSDVMTKPDVELAGDEKRPDMIKIPVFTGVKASVDDWVDMEYRLRPDGDWDASWNEGEQKVSRVVSGSGYPAWRNVIPNLASFPPVEYVTVKSRYLWDMERAFKLLDPKYGGLLFKGTDKEGLGPLVAFGPEELNAIGVIMPVRRSAGSLLIPDDWKLPAQPVTPTTPPTEGAG